MGSGLSSIQDLSIGMHSYIVFVLTMVIKSLTLRNWIMAVMLWSMDDSSLGFSNNISTFLGEKTSIK